MDNIILFPAEMRALNELLRGPISRVAAQLAEADYTGTIADARDLLTAELWSLADGPLLPD